MRAKDSRPVPEEVTVSSGELVDKVKALIHQGNVRRLVVRRPSGQALMEIPLNYGIGVSGVLLLMAPVLAALAAMAALIAQFRIEIERDPRCDPDAPPALPRRGKPD